MSSTVETLRRMANQIATNVAVRGHDAAVEATAEHISKFWDPRMKSAIFARYCSDVARWSSSIVSDACSSFPIALRAVPPPPITTVDMCEPPQISQPW